jgi:hypothetical protein
MAKRGRIVRDPTSGPGLVMVQGRQHVFPLEGVWRSDSLPRPGVVVDVDFDDAGRVLSMVAVPEARLAREQAEAAIAFAAAKGADIGTALLSGSGLAQLAALGLLVLGWFWLDAMHIEAAPLGDWKLTFWQVLGVLNAGHPTVAPGSGVMRGAGLYGLAALISLAGPFLAFAVRDRRAHLAALLPLALMCFVALQFAGLAGSGAVRAAAPAAGGWLAMLAGLWFAAAGVRRYLIARACNEAVYYDKQLPAEKPRG